MDMTDATENFRHTPDAFNSLGRLNAKPNSPLVLTNEFIDRHVPQYEWIRRMLGDNRHYFELALPDCRFHEHRADRLITTLGVLTHFWDVRPVANGDVRTHPIPVSFFLRTVCEEASLAFSKGELGLHSTSELRIQFNRVGHHGKESFGAKIIGNAIVVFTPSEASSLPRAFGKGIRQSRDHYPDHPDTTGHLDSPFEPDKTVALEKPVITVELVESSTEEDLSSMDASRTDTAPAPTLPRKARNLIDKRSIIPVTEQYVASVLPDDVKELSSLDLNGEFFDITPLARIGGGPIAHSGRVVVVDKKTLLAFLTTPFDGKIVRDPATHIGGLFYEGLYALVSGRPEITVVIAKQMDQRDATVFSAFVEPLKSDQSRNDALIRYHLSLQS